MKIFFTLPILFLFVFSLSPNHFQTSKTSLQHNNNQPLTKKIHLNSSNERILISSHDEMQTLELLGFELGKNYIIQIIGIEDCLPEINNTLISQQGQRVEFNATKVVQTVQVFSNECSEPMYLSVSCLNCEKEEPQAENSMMNLEVDHSLTPEELVEQVLFPNGCGTVTNVQGIGPNVGRGSFLGGGIGLDEGVILSTGFSQEAAGPNITTNTGTNIGGGSDPDLAIFAGALPVFDAVGLEFDFTPSSNRIDFFYVFGSEEYCEWVGSQFNDHFGFFISGPGINGPFTNGAINIATVPNSTEPVTINNINHTINQSFFVPNTADCGSVTNPQNIEFDGYTTILNAFANLIPQETYHIKLVVGDIGDGIYDSAVLIGGNVTNINAVIAPPEEITCNNAEIELDGSSSSTGPNFTYTWSGPNGFTSNDFPIILVDEEGSYCLEVTNTMTGDVCSTCVDVFESTNHAEIIIIPPTILTCDNGLVELDGSLSSSGNHFFYEWDGPNNFKSNDFPTVLVDKPGIYCLEVLDTNTGEICSDCIEVEASGSMAIISSPDTLSCTQLEVELNGSNSSFTNNFTFLWEGPNGFSLVEWPKVFVSEPGVYTLTLTDIITNEVCVDSVEVFQISSPLDDPEVMGPDTLWFGSVGYYFSPSPDTTITDYHWQITEGNILFGDSTTNFVILDMGDTTETTLCLSTENDCSISNPTCIDIVKDSAIFQASIEGEQIVCGSALETYWLATEDTTVTNIEWLAFGMDTLIQMDIDTVDIRWDTLALGIVCANIQSDDYGHYQLCEVIEIDTNTTPAIGIIDTTLCDGDSIIIANEVFYDDGFYLINIPTNQGCDSLVQLSLTVLEAASIIAPPNILGCGQSVVLDGTASTIIADIGATLTYNWSGPSIIGPNDDPITSVNEGGVYCLTITHEKNGVVCEDQSCVTVIEDNTVPNTPTFDGLTVECTGNTTTYSITNYDSLNTTSFTWTTPNGETFTQINPLEILVFWDNSNGGDLCVIANNACGSSPVFCLNIEIEDVPQDPVLVAPMEVCEGEDVVLEVTNPQPSSSYQWITAGSNNHTTVPSFAILLPYSETVCVIMENACGTSNQSCVFVEVNPLPPTPEIIGGETSCLNFVEVFSVANFNSDLTYNWMVPPSANMTGDGEHINVEFTEPGFQNVCLTAENDCGISAQYCLEVEVLEEVIITNVNLECEPNNVEYILSFEISGGLPGYDVLGMDGSINNDIFTSETQLVGGGYDLTITDSYGCNAATFSNSNVTCDCVTDAGSMENNLVEICGAQILEGQHFGDEFLDNNDAFYFVFCADESDPLNSILVSNIEPIFDYDPALMNFGETYYIFAIAGNSDNDGNPNFIDPCLSISNAQPVTFSPANIPISITNDTTICDGSVLQLNATAPNAISYEWHPAATLSCSSCPNPIASPESSTNYTVTVIDDEGCVDTENVEIFVQCFTVYDTLAIGQVAIQSLNLPPWQVVSPADICDDDDDGHISYGMFPGNSGVFYVGLSEGTDTLCILLEHPNSAFITETFTIYATIIKKPIFNLEEEDERFYVIKDDLKGTTNQEYLAQDVEIYPNPADSFTKIVSNKSPLLGMEIFNLSGQLIRREKLDGFEKEISLELLNKGVYLFKIQTEKGWFFEKVIH